MDRDLFVEKLMLTAPQHLKPPQAISHSMTIRAKIPPPIISFIWRLCSHILRRNCLPCLWKLSACIQYKHPPKHINYEVLRISKSFQILQPDEMTRTWNCRFSDLSTRSSIFSPRSKTCHQEIPRFSESYSIQNYIVFMAWIV